VFYKGRKMPATSPNTDLHGYGESIRKELGKRIPRGARLKVLDVGTGFGINVAFLAGRLSKDGEIWSVDPSKEALKAVKAGLAEELQDRVRFAHATADDLDFPGRLFDVAVSVMVLHHMGRLRPALKEMARVLKPGGTMVLVDYKPEASHNLEFKSLHEEKDFFDLATVTREIARLGMRARPQNHRVWYLVEAAKPKTQLASTSGATFPRKNTSGRTKTAE